MSSRENSTVLIAYDGSEPARAAVEQAARLLAPRQAVVLTAWQSAVRAAAVSVIGMPADVAAEGVERLDEAAAAAAARTAGEGAELAGSAGLEATPEVRAAERNEWSAIVAAADELDVAAVVVGSRGRSRISSAVLGSVSNGVVQHCSRPVLVVPGTERA